MIFDNILLMGRKTKSIKTDLKACEKLRLISFNITQAKFLLIEVC